MKPVAYRHTIRRITPAVVVQDRIIANTLIRIASAAAGLDAIAAIQTRSRKREHVIPRFAAALAMVDVMGLSKARASKAAGVSRVMMFAASRSTMEDRRLVVGFQAAKDAARRRFAGGDDGQHERNVRSQHRATILDVVAKFAKRFRVTPGDVLGSRVIEAVSARRLAIRELVDIGLPRRVIAEGFGIEPVTVTRVATKWSPVLSRATDRRCKEYRRAQVRAARRNAAQAQPTVAC